MDSNSGHIIDDLRAEHQALARDAARTGVIPRGFQDDPTFLELVANLESENDEPAGEAS